MTDTSSTLLLTCFTNPLKISLKGFTEVFSHPEFSEGFSSFHSGSLIAKFPKNIIEIHVWQISTFYPLRTPRTRFSIKNEPEEINVCFLLFSLSSLTTYYYQRHKVCPVPMITYSIICLEIFNVNILGILLMLFKILVIKMRKNILYLSEWFSLVVFLYLAS